MHTVVHLFGNEQYVPRTQIDIKNSGVSRFSFGHDILLISGQWATKRTFEKAETFSSLNHHKKGGVLVNVRYRYRLQLVQDNGACHQFPWKNWNSNENLFRVDVNEEILETKDVF